MNESNMPPRGSIELFGLCGVGKSTVLQELVPILCELGGAQAPSIETPVVPTSTAYRIELLRILLRVGVQAPLSLAKLSSAPEGLWLPRKLAYRIAGLRMRPPTDLSFLIDSSVLQPFVSFTIEENLSGAAIPAQALFAAVPKPVCAIYARAATTTAVDRYTARQKANAAPLFENGLEKRFQNGAAMCEWLRSACHEIKVPVLELDIEKRCERRALEDFAACLLSQCRPVPHAR